MFDNLIVSPSDERYAVKATDLGDNRVKLQGYGVVFDSPDSGNTDLEGDFFTEDTDFGPRVMASWAEGRKARAGSLINHGFPLDEHFAAKAVADEPIGVAELTKDDWGVLYEIVLDVSNAYHEFVANLAEQKKLGLSSTALNLPATFRRTKDGWLKRWWLSEVGPTPAPAEPRTTLMTAKSWFKSCGCGNGDKTNEEVLEVHEESEDIDYEAVEEAVAALAEAIEGEEKQFDFATPFPFASHEACVMAVSGDDDIDDADAFCSEWERQNPKSELKSYLNPSSIEEIGRFAISEAIAEITAS